MCSQIQSMVYAAFLIVSHFLIGVFAFGLFATDIFVNAGQVVTGHLTPYFLTVCKPNYTSGDCRMHHQFINNGNICTGDLEVIEKARRSFPSKHAALSIYSALYATVSFPDIQVLLSLPGWCFSTSFILFISVSLSLSCSHSLFLSHTYKHTYWYIIFITYIFFQSCYSVSLLCNAIAPTITYSSSKFYLHMCKVSLWEWLH